MLNLLKRHWPDAQISWLVGSNFAGLLDGHPQLQEVIRFDRHRFASAWWNPKALSRADCSSGSALRRRHFDLIIDLQGLLRSGVTARLARSPVRVGFRNARELAWIFYTHRVTVDPEQHAVDRYLKIAEALGCQTGPVDAVFPTTDEDRAAIEALLPEHRPFAVLLPGTNWETKRWPVEYFAALVGPLKQRYGLASVVAGGNDSRQLAAKIPGAWDLTGRTSSAAARGAARNGQTS